MAYTIYDKNGNERLALIEESLQPNAGRFVEPQLEYNGTWMGECFVTLNIKSPVPIKFAIGDYVMYRGEKFVINYDPSVIKKATKKSTGDAFCYDNVKFSALSYELSDIRMLDFVIDGNNLHWNGLPRFSVFCPSIEEFADRLQANTDRWCAENNIGSSEKWLFVTPNYNRCISRAGSGTDIDDIYEDYFTDLPDTDDEMTNQNVSIDNMTVWDSLKYIKETFGLNFIVRGRAVIIGAAGIPVDGIFQYGKDNGLYEIERVADSEQQIVTKLFAYGTDKNLPTRYYADLSGGDLPNNLAVNALMLPGFPEESLYEWVHNYGLDHPGTVTNEDSYTGQATWNGYTAIFSKNPQQPYIQSVNAASLGIREATKYFDGSDGTEEVYPSITAFNTNTVYSAQVIEDAGVFPAGQEVADFTITLSSFGANDFVLSDYITAESAISMLDGSCGGRDFQIVSATQDSETLRWTLTCHRVHDESLDLWFPYSDGVAHGGSASASELYQIHSGDHFVFVGIEMPEEYVEAASERLLEGALQFLAKNDATRYTYIPKVDEIYMARQSAEAEQSEEIPIHDKIKEGGLMLFEDTDLGISTNAVFIDTLRIKEYGNQQIPTYEVTLRNEKQVGTIQRIQEQIGKITSGETSIGGGTGGSVNIPLVKSLIQTYGTDLFLRKDKESTAQEIIRFLKGIRFGSSNQWYIDKDGKAVLQDLNVENLNALNAHFAQLIIDEIKSVGGMVVISPSNAKIHKVEIEGAGGRSESYRIYFKATDGDRKVYQSFMSGDQIVCAQFNAAASGYTLEDVSNKFYWRRVWRTSTPTSPETVDGVACHWIDVFTQGDSLGSGIPQVGDEIAVLGNSGSSADQVKRQNAIVISAYDIDWLDTGYGQEGDSDYVPKLKAPFIVQYAGINNFTLYNKRVNVISQGLNVFKGDFKANTGEDLMEVISQIEEGRLSFVHQAWAEDAVEITDTTSPNFGGWTLTGFNLAYFSGAKYMCFLSDHTEGEAHLNETIFSSAPQPSANPPIPKKNWMPVDFEIISEDYTYAITNNGNKPADSAFIYTESNLPTLQKGQYLWIKCDLEYSNGLTSTSYSVSNIGEDGEAGIDGVGSYLYIAYATSADGSQGFSKTDTGGKTYIGVYRGILLHPNDIPEDPDDYTIYKWSRYVGDAGLNGLSAPPPYKETPVPHYLVYASGTGVTKSTSGWVDNNAPALTDEKPYLWRYDTTTYENVGGVENLLKNSTNPAQNALTDTYIAKIRLADGKQLVNGETYSIVLNAEDLSVWSVTSCTIRVYYNRSSNKFYTQATGVKQEADGTIRATFTANVDTTAGVTQWGIYVTAVGLVRPDTAYPEVYWAMLTEGDVQYSWIAAPEDLKKETTPAVVATKGRGIGQIAEYYAKNNSNTTPPSGWQTSPYTGWSTTPVAADSTNMYVWNFEVITYTDGEPVVTTPHVSSGYALGISNKTVTYAVTTSTSQPQDSAFTATTVPTVNKGEYLWTKTEITYGDNSVTKAYSVSYKATDGTSPYFADIDNEMDSVPCTSAGVTTAAFDKTLNVKMWHGSSEIALTTLSANTISGITITANKTAKTVRVQVASGTTIAAVNNIVITIAGSGSGNMTLNFTLNGIRAGANGTNGTNAVIYNIVPEKDSINVARDGSAYVPANVSITCGYVKNDGGTATKVNDVSSRIDSKYNLYFRRRTRSNHTFEGTYYLYDNGTTSYKSYLTSLAVATYDAVEFVLSTATAGTRTTSNIGTIIDRETVPIVSDGEEGNGISGAVVAYGKSSSGTTQPTSWQSTIPSVPLGQYLWTRVTTSYTDGSADTVSYSISRIGADGAQGTPGATGENGQTTYLHIVYANSADGSVNFNTSYFTGASYIGTKTDFDIDDPNDYTLYEWAELRGMDNAGVYVTDVKNYYKVTNTNATPAIDNTWVLCPPGTIPQPTNTNRYLWNYEVTEYGCQYPNMVLGSDNPRIGGDPYIFRFDNTTNGFVHGEVYSFAMKLGQLPSPKTYYVLQIQGATYKDGTQTSTSRAISQKVGQNPEYPTRLVPNEEGIITGTFECDLHSSNTYGDIDHEQHIWVSAYPEGGTYDVPSFDWITVVKGTQVASWSKALSELTQTIPPHLIATQGEKGDSAWVADLTNEMDSVQCDDTGYVVSQQSVSTALSLFYGVTEKNFGTPTVKRNGSTITIGTATNGVTVTYSNKALTVAYDTAAKITGKDEFAITITATDDSSTVRTLTFTVNGIKGDVYNLLPSFEEIKATRDDNGSYVVSGSNIVSLTCGYTKNINGVVTTGTTDLLDDASTTLDLEGRYNIYFRRRNRSTQSYASSGRWYRYTYATYRAYLVQTETEGVTSGGLNIDTYDAVDFVICTNTANYVANASLANVIDRETVYVVADGLKGGKGDFTATVFKRQNTQPATPTGGTYANPVPSGWSDGIPSGGEMVWASTRIFKIDDNTTTWTTPQQMTDTMTYDVEFAYEISENATPVAPNENNSHKDASPYGYEGQIWFDPAKDKYSAQGVERDFTTMAWRAERDCTNGVWSDWTIVRIKGERGSIITGAVLTRSYTASQWETYSSKSPTEQTYWVDDDDNTVLTLCEKGDIFIVQGEATDTHDFYQLYYRYDHPYSGSSTSESTRKRRYCYFISCTVSKAGSDGAAGATGPTGAAGKGVSSVTEKYLLSNLNTGITVAGNTWSDSILTPTEDKPYLWNYEETLWTDNTTTNSTPHILTTYTRAAAGDAFISGVYNWYVVTGQSSGVTRSNPADGTWVKCPPNDTPVPTSEKRYLWNYEETVWDQNEQGRNLVKSFTQSSQYTIAVCTLSTAVTIVQGATYTASIRLNVPSTKNQIRFGWYGKTTSSASNTTHYITELDQSISPGLQTVTVTFVMPTFYTLSSFRVYLNPSNSSYEIAEIEWIKLEKGALPTPYSEAPENLTTYTDPHVVCIHGESGADAEVYTLSPVNEVAGVQLPQDGGINSTIRQLVVGLSYKILKVEGASYEEISPRPDNNSDGFFLRFKRTYVNGTTDANPVLFETNAHVPTLYYTFTYSNYTAASNQPTAYTVELVRKAGNTYTVLDTRIVYVSYIASAAFEVDKKLHEIRSIVQGSSFDGNGGLQKDVSSVTERADTLETKVEQQRTDINNIQNTYATQSLVTQTATEIRSQVYGGMINGANLLLRSKEQASGFDSSLSTAAVQGQTNKYFACFSFGNIKPTGTDTILVSWQQTNVSGLTYRVMLYGKYPSGEYGTFKASGNLTTSANGYYARKFSLEGYTAEKVVIYATATSPSSLTEVAWAKAEFCDANATTADATGWTPAIEETGSEIKQTADEIIMAVEGTGIDITNQQITLNGDTQINGTLTLSNTGDGFMLRSDSGSALITPESIGSYNSFNTTTYTSSPQYHQEAGGFYKDASDNSYRTIPYSMYINIGTFSSNSEIKVESLTFSHIVLTDNYPSVTGTEEGTITFYEGSNEESHPLTTGTTYSYITSVNGASVGIRILGYFKVAENTTSYTLLDSLKSGNIVTMFGFTLRTPVQGAFVRVASDGLGVNAGNGKTAYFGPDGFHITPLLQNVKTISANYTASFTDDIIMVNNSSTVTLTLPTNGAIPEGKKIYVKKMTSSSTLRVQATYGSSGMIYKCNSASAVAYEDSTSPVMTYYISFDTGSGIGWLQGYCG